MNEIIRFLNQMYRVLESTLDYVVKGKKIILELGTGGAYTDGIKMHIGVPEQFKGMSKKIVYMLTVALIGHEGQHVLSSNFTEFGRYNNEETLKLMEKGVSEKFASRYVHTIGNIVEDGRIENILVNRLPGFIPKIQYMNMFFWDKNEIREDMDEFSAFINTLLTLSVLGIYPKNYQVLEGSRVDREVDKVKHLIEQGVAALTCKDGLDICREILAITEPFILDLYKDIKADQDRFDELMKSLVEFLEQHENCEEEDYNDSQKHTSRFIEMKEEKKKKKPTPGKGKGKEEESEEESKEGKGGSSSKKEKAKKGDKKRLSSRKSKSEDDEDDEEDDGDEEAEDSDEYGDADGDEEADGDKDSDGKKSGDAKGDEGKEDAEDVDGDADNDAGGDGDGDSDGDAEGDGEKESSEAGDETGDENDVENNKTQNLSRGLEGGEELKPGDENIHEKMEELAKRLVAEAEKDILKNERDQKAKTRNAPKDYRLNREELQNILKGCKYRFEETNDGFPLEAELPNETKIAANKFKRQIKDLFHSKAMGSVLGQEKGTLDVDNIFRVGMKKYDVFKTETTKSSREHVLFILRDGSGSMSGEKDMESILSLAIIEEGLKGVVPFKAVTFNTSMVGVRHIVIKDWNDKSKKNYAYNYIKSYQATGGNVDGVSIRIAAEELLKRPEKDKTLIVLSDGLPDSREDTKNAIKYAREKGVNVIGIMFGDENFRVDNLPEYREMYQKNIIATKVDKIADKLTGILKETLKQ